MRIMKLSSLLVESRAWRLRRFFIREINHVVVTQIYRLTHEQLLIRGVIAQQEKLKRELDVFGVENAFELVAQ